MFPYLTKLAGLPLLVCTTDCELLWRWTYLSKFYETWSSVWHACFLLLTETDGPVHVCMLFSKLTYEWVEGFFFKDWSLETRKIMLDLSGESFILRVLQTEEQRDFFAVAMSTRTLTPGKSKMWTPLRKSSLLYKRQEYAYSKSWMAAQNEMSITHPYH